MTGYPFASDIILFCYAAAVWGLLDGTRTGLFMSLLTAVAGPAVEIALINGLGLYAYSHPQMGLGVPTWIPWVYACGGPAVGLLGRRIWATLKEQQSSKVA